MSPVKHHEHVYKATLPSILRKAKNGTFARKKEWSYRPKIWHADTTSLCKQHGMDPIWSHLFLFVCRAKNAKNGTSLKKKRKKRKKKKKKKEKKTTFT